MRIEFQSLTEFDSELIAKYDKSGPRYTSYPTAVQFTDALDADRYREIARATNAQGSPLSLYFHIPFCDTVCFYCACNKIATKDRSLAQPYLELMYREMELQGALFDRQRVVEQLHWGGGTPTFISHAQMQQLMEQTRQHFTLLDDDRGEYSIEIDPREADRHTIGLLRGLGFNRMSLGVQDLQPDVQQAVNRLQPFEQTLEVLESARQEGFGSVSLDLIYGLPRQTPDSFAGTIEEILKLLPDRLSVFNYAHLPERFKPQRRIDEGQLPSPQAKLEILKNTIAQLTEAGYVYVGMDHFAKPDDELVIAQREHTLYRNFQGYSTHADCDLIGIGVTSIGMVGDCYAQNHRDMESYRNAIASGDLAVFRGVRLNRDDRLRRDLITRLICHFHLDKAAFAAQWGIDFDDYFAAQQLALERMQQDGLLLHDAGRIQVLPVGRLLIRNICMLFDAYLGGPSAQGNFSKTI